MYTCAVPAGNQLTSPLRFPQHVTKHRFVVSRAPAFGCAASRRGVQVLAKSSSDPWPAPTSYKLWPTEIAISPGIYNAILGAELVAYAALVDAGFSGDWSRIGVLTTDQELVAQQVWWFILAAHSVVAAITVRLALREGYPALTAGVKGLLFGSLGLYDVYLRCEAAKKQ